MIIVVCGPPAAGGPANSCNSCSPAIPDDLNFIGSDFMFDWAILNDTITLSWTSGCNWNYTFGGGETLNLDWGGSRWELAFYKNATCKWTSTGEGPVDSCAPQAVWWTDGAPPGAAGAGCDNPDSDDGSWQSNVEIANVP